ncbi:hypothetical protein [Spirochaeta isovalerica]|uniref:Lipoprotein n=1 Tax=Spirochaeta isovalerica TaxID=150 RepID=A0A841R7L0_9SPIO|nr:hypothetical protein [Spirochaeta isovalerica]MBB6479816.1 hypothetical protein [Spirochaeta isovalerica]
MKKSVFALSAVFLLFWLGSCQQPGPGDPENPDIPENKVDLELLVLDSLNGSPVDGVEVKLYPEGDSSPAYTGVSRSDGSVIIAVNEDEADILYDIVSAKNDRASCKIQSFSFENGKLPVLYNHDLMMTSFSAEAPSITSVEYSGNGTDWFVAEGSIDSADLNYIRVSARARTEIKETSWCGYGIKISLNGIITHWDGLAASSFEKEGEQIGSTGYYETVALFDLSTHDYMAGSYSLFVNAYDVAANRVEQTSELIITTDAPSADASLAGVIPVITQFTGKTYSVSRDYYGTPIDPVKRIALPEGSTTFNGEGTTYYIALDISIAEEIRRIDVLRSDDGGNTYKVLDRNLTFSNPTSAGNYSYSDFDPTIELEHSYFYKVIAYNGSGASEESESVSLTLLPPHNTLLTAPANKSTSDSLMPEFTFSITNTELLDTDRAQYLQFQLQIRDTTAPIYSLPIKWDRVNNTLDILGNAVPSEYVGYFVNEDTAAGTITVYYSGFNLIFGLSGLEAGKTYEWNIIDEGHGTYFSNEYYNNDGTILLGQEQSLASNSASGQGTLNGWFTLTISDMAQ